MIKIERWAWDDAERDIIAARGVVELLAEEAMRGEVNADACDAVHCLITHALELLNSGRVYGSETPELMD